LNPHAVTHGDFPVPLTHAYGFILRALVAEDRCGLLDTER
jgi:hypothetical protein